MWSRDIRVYQFLFLSGDMCRLYRLSFLLYDNVDCLFVSKASKNSVENKQ